MSAVTPRRADRRRGAASRGAVALEMVIALPLLVLIVFAMVEMGFGWRDSRTISNATRAGARVASNLGPERLADYEALSTLKAAVSRIDDGDIQMIIVYRAYSVDGEVPASCTAGGGTDVSGLCNAYTASDLASLAVSDFPGTTSCSAGALDEAWCPTVREADQIAGPDYVGVYIELRHPPVTGIFPGGDITISDWTVMRIEPRTS